MKFGVVYPQTEMPPDPLAIRDYAQAVESLGFRARSCLRSCFRRQS